jgi:predicted nucleic acid-binding protein
MKSNVKILGVSREAYLAATQLGRDLTLDPNDALAIDIMRANDLKEIYTFDEHFNHVEGITKLPKLRTGKI